MKRKYKCVITDDPNSKSSSNGLEIYGDGQKMVIKRNGMNFGWPIGLKIYIPKAGLDVGRYFNRKCNG